MSTQEMNWSLPPGSTSGPITKASGGSAPAWLTAKRSPGRHVSAQPYTPGIPVAYPRRTFLVHRHQPPRRVTGRSVHDAAISRRSPTLSVNRSHRARDQAPFTERPVLADGVASRRQLSARPRRDVFAGAWMPPRADRGCQGHHCGWQLADLPDQRHQRTSAASQISRVANTDNRSGP
jgi:hypothetical protein